MKMVLGKIITVISILALTTTSEFHDISTCVAPDGNNYQINSTFVTSDCLLQCVCTPNGHIGCVPLCPTVRLKCPIGYKRKEATEHAGVKGSGCFCERVTCKALSNNVRKTSYCFEGDEYYKPGEEFIRNCTKLCRCHKKGLARCVPLCPYDKPCPFGTTEVAVTVPVEYNRGSCTCKRKVCKPLLIEDKCLINGRYYKPGDDLISPDCSSRCKCHPGGSVFCVSLCPPEGINCQHDEDTIKLLRKIPNSNCSCPTWRCVKKQEETMVFKGLGAATKRTCTSASGNIYRVGEVFVDQNCSLKCHCQDGGKVTCQGLCADKSNIQSCDPSEKRKIVNMPILLPRADGQNNCSCPIEICEPTEDKCIVGDYTYKPGDDFVSPDCSGYCKCYSGGSVLCVSLCTPERISCQLKEYKIQLSRKIPNTNCTCPTWKCLKKKQEVFTGNTCVSRTGNVYRIGQVFSDQNCTLQCYCKDGGKIRCRRLCAANHPQTCAPFENQKIKLLKVTLPDGEGKSCSCPMTICEPREAVREVNNVQCTVGEYTYNPGDDFVSPDCSGYCKCHPGGSVLCVSLCPPEGITCQHNEDTIQLSRKIPNSNCTCPTWRCLKKKQEVTTRDMSTCVSKTGNIYQIGQVFSDQNCTLQCHCEDGGKTTCRPLCPDNIRTQACSPLENEKVLNLPVPLPDGDGKSCSCSTKICERREVVRKAFNDECLVDGHSYKLGETFISADCSGYCKCVQGQIVICGSLCPPQEITCQREEVKKQLYKKIPNSNCSCPKWRCIKKKNNGICIVDGKKYQIGKRFIGLNCAGYCRCYGPNKVVCVSLCPPHYVHCKPGETKIKAVRLVGFGSNCTCPTWKCVKDSNNWTLWSNWTKCAASCGGGLRHRHRTCKTKICVGSDTETQVCNTKPCSAAFNENPCGSIRVRAKLGGPWPRCDDDGFFANLQCNPITSQCWCVDKLGNEEPGSRLLAQIPQCKSNFYPGQLP